MTGPHQGEFRVDRANDRLEVFTGDGWTSVGTVDLSEVSVAFGEIGRAAQQLSHQVQVTVVPVLDAFRAALGQAFADLAVQEPRRARPQACGRVRTGAVRVRAQRAIESGG